MRPIQTSRYSIDDLAEKTGLSTKDLLRAGADGLLQYFVNIKGDLSFYTAKCLDLKFSDRKVGQCGKLPRPSNTISELSLARYAPVDSLSLERFIEEAEQERLIAKEPLPPISSRFLLHNPFFKVTHDNILIDKTKYLVSDEIEEWITERDGRTVTIKKLTQNNLNQSGINFLSPLKIWVNPLSQPIEYDCKKDPDGFEKIKDILRPIAQDYGYCQDQEASNEDKIKIARDEGDLYFIGELTVFTEDKKYIEWATNNNLLDKLYSPLTAEEKEHQPTGRNQYEKHLSSFLAAIDDIEGFSVDSILGEDDNKKQRLIKKTIKDHPFCKWITPSSFKTYWRQARNNKFR